MTCDRERVLVTFQDGVRAIVCRRCYTGGIIECIEIASDTPCQTEISLYSWRAIPGAWPQHRMTS